MSDTPSAAIVAEAQKVTQIKDARGRVLNLRRLNVLDQVRLLRAIGAQQSGNEPYVNIVQCAAMVSAIDAVPIPFPANERMIDAAIDKIGDEGIAAISVHFQAEVARVQKAAEEALAGGGEVSANPLMTPAS